MIAADLPRVSTEVKHQAEQERQTPGDTFAGFYLDPYLAPTNLR